MTDKKADKSKQADGSETSKPVVVGKPGFARRQTRIYIGLLALFGLIGYSWFFLFPLLAVYSLYVIVDELLLALQYADGMRVSNFSIIGVASLSMLLGGFMSYRIFLVRIPLPLGVKIDKENSGKIFPFVGKLKETYPGLKIDQIILTDRFEVQIIKTPLWGYPVWSKNTLSIGMPLLLGLPLEHFKVILLRKLGQFSRNNNPVTNWLYCLRQIMQDYHQALLRDPQLDKQFLALFFNIYLPLFDSLGGYILQLDELKADSSALEHINHEDVVLALEMEYLVARFLDTHYWPKVRQMVEQNPKASPFGCARLLPTLEGNLAKVNLKLWLAESRKMSLLTYDKMPNLRQRLENVGHDKPLPITLAKGSAATQLLGDAFYRALKVADMFWSKNTADKWRKESEIRRREQAIIQQLQQKNTNTRLSIKELLQWRNLKQKYSKEPVSLPIYRFLIGKLPKSTNLPV